MRDLKVIALTLLAVYLYQSVSPSTWTRLRVKANRVVAVVSQ